MQIALSLIRGTVKLAIFLVTLAILAGAGITLYQKIKEMRPGGSGAEGTPVVGEGSADLSAAERAFLSAYLTANAAGLEEPAGDDDTPVKFKVVNGDSASTIASRLATAKLIENAELFRYYMRYHGLDKEVEAGDFMLAQTMTIPEIAEKLGHALASDVVIRVTEGWRIEQIGEEISKTEGITVTYDDFVTLAGPGADFGQFDTSFTTELPEGASLEGFMFPDTYLIAPDATARDIIERMLQTFDERVTAEMRAAYNARGLNLFQAVTLASIVEREAVVEEERPLIASVYLNRLDIGMKLDADPTIQYGMGFDEVTGQWWRQLLLDDLQFDSPYNTYLYPGLPPGPIANPGLDSLMAIAEPAETSYIFFRAACDGSGKHNFSETFEEHNAFACPEN